MWEGGRVSGRGGVTAQTPGGGRSQQAHRITHGILYCDEGRRGGGSPVGGVSIIDLGGYMPRVMSIMVKFSKCLAIAGQHQT